MLGSLQPWPLTLRAIPTDALEKPIKDVKNSFELVTDRLNGWLDALIELSPDLIVAAVVVVTFSLVARLVRHLSARFLVRLAGGRGIANLLSTLAGAAVVLIGVFIALGILNLDKAVTSLLAGAGVLGIALAFAFQDLAANLIAGVYLSFQRPFVIGDLIETHDVFGTVESVDLRNSILRTHDGRIVVLPNREIFENKLINYSRSGTRRIEVQVGVSYGDDLDKVLDVTRQAIESVEPRDTSQPCEVFFVGFGGSSIDLVARFWIPFQRQTQYRRAVSDAVMAVKTAYERHDVVIPFPIRTLDFGIKGGRPLSLELSEAPADEPA